MYLEEGLAVLEENYVPQEEGGPAIPVALLNKFREGAYRRAVVQQKAGEQKIWSVQGITAKRPWNKIKVISKS